MGSFQRLLVLAAVGTASYATTTLTFGQPTSPFDVGKDASRAELVAEGDTISDRLAVIVVSAYCSASNSEHLPDAWDRIVTRETAGHPGLRTIGVALAAPTGAGIDFLKRFGGLDEVLSGRGWDTLGGLEFLFGDLGGPGAVPQVIIVDRKIVSSGAGTPQVGRQRVVGRYVGIPAILQFADRAPSR